MPLLDKLTVAPKLRKAVNLMIEEAKTADDERRRDGRLPYFQPVTIQLEDSPELYPAFTRDISPTGIGLLHWMPIQPQRISLLSRLQDGSQHRFGVKITWCVACGEGWYLSGGRFVSLD